MSLTWRGDCFRNRFKETFLYIYCLQFFRKINGSGDIKIDYEHKWLIHIFLTYGSVKEIEKSRKEVFYIINRIVSQRKLVFFTRKNVAIFIVDAIHKSLSMTVKGKKLILFCLKWIRRDSLVSETCRELRTPQFQIYLLGHVPNLVTDAMFSFFMLLAGIFHKDDFFFKF